MTWLDALTMETVVVHTTDGTSLKGVRSAVHDDCLVLRDVIVLGEEDAVLNGEIVVPRERVSFMQLVPAAGAA